MRIGIDARLIGETGVGRYIRNLIEQLQLQDRNHTYIVYLPKSAYEQFHVPNARWEKRLATARWHTVWEQIVMPVLFLNDALDLVHVPYFNIPVLYPKKFIMTVHDLTILHVVTGKATRLPYPLYRLKVWVYQWILSVGVSRAVYVIVPSYTTKKEIVEHFHVAPEKIQVTYEGVDNKITNDKLQMTNDKRIKKPYFLYVGNAYPHKNLDRLIDAFADFIGDSEKKYQLILVGKQDYFYDRLQTKVHDMKLDSSVHFFQDVDDAMLYGLYRHALALAFPSLMEGFGLPALEAISKGTPVMCSDIPIFHEILGVIPTYFDPYDKKSIVSSFSKMSSQKRILSLKEKHEVQEHMKKFSWQKLGKETLALYTDSNMATSDI